MLKPGAAIWPCWLTLKRLVGAIVHEFAAARREGIAYLRVEVWASASQGRAPISRWCNCSGRKAHGLGQQRVALAPCRLVGGPGDDGHLLHTEALGQLV